MPLSERIIRDRKIEEGETIRRYLERMLLRMVKRWYFREYPDLRSEYKTDRGQLLESKLERIVGGSGIRKEDVREALSRVGLVIYRKKGALEYPAMILFCSNVGKYSTVFSSNEAVSLFRRLYPNIVGNFVSVEEEKGESLKPDDFEYLEHIVVEPNETKALERVSSILQGYFDVRESMQLSYRR